MKKSMVFEAVAVLLLILLLFAMYAMVTSGSPASIDKWNATVGPSTYLFAGNNGTLYAFDSNRISAIAGDGSVKWSLHIPDNRTMMDSDNNHGVEISSRSRGEPAFAYYNDILFVYTRPVLDQNATPIDMQNNITPAWSIMAVSPDGKILWDTPLVSGDSGPRVEGLGISATNDKIYVYYGPLTVLGTNGSILFTINRIMAHPSVDEEGNVYAIKSNENGTFDGIYGYNGTFNTIVAYHPDGSFWWQKEMGDSLQERYLDTSLNLINSAQPLYNNGMLYAAHKKSLTAFDRNGTELWTRDFKGNVYTFMSEPFDSQNNIYLAVKTLPIPGNDRIVYEGVKVSANGTCSNYTIMRDDNSPMAVSNGVGYYYSINNWISQPGGGIADPSNLTDLISQSITAVDIETGKTLWNFTVPVNNINEITLDPSNAYYLDEISADREKYALYYGPSSLAYPASANMSIEYNKKHPEIQNLNKSAIGPWKVAGEGTMKLLPGDKAVYVSYFMYNYEYPASLTRPPYDDGSDASTYPYAAIFNRSKLAYSGGILAIDNNGHLLWNRPMDSMVTTMAANNSTVFYGTSDGTLSATQVNAAVGFALAAIVYLFLRFMAVGAVARAKARINKNDKRNLVLDFIVKNPGSSLYEIARGSGVNLGTVRYHLFILVLNHKIVESHTDGKYVRYFTNSGTYSKEEQLIISLMRRDSMGRMLGLMVETPGISNAEIARKLEIRESVVCRCVKELSEKGVVARDMDKGCFVDEGHREYVASAARRIFGQ